MTIMKPSASLDTWRDYFHRGDSDIFGIIEHAIMVAATDSPVELKSRRDAIIELLMRYDQPDLSKAGDKETNNSRKTVEADDGGHEEDEAKLNVNQIVDEVMRIKDILLNKHVELSVLFKSLTKLASMSISLDLIKGSEIGKAVNRLRKHGSDNISKLAKTLIKKWTEMVDQLINTPKEVAAADDGMPESATLSIVDEAENFPSLPHDLDLYAEPTVLELSQFLDSLDCDGSELIVYSLVFYSLLETLPIYVYTHGMVSDLPDFVEPKHERKVQSRMIRRPVGTCEANVVGRDTNNQQMRRKEADVRPMRHSAPVLDETRRQPKQTREQMVRTNQRKPNDVAEQKRKLAGSQQDKLKVLDQEAKFENAKRKLQESYQQHEKAKRQRKIQVLETIPNQSKAQRPLLKRPVRR
ncbi:probable mediator of RNA polymerase II transcription subunit 26a isoform X1 [Brassica rapa]|uniref:probable mediator of RNA polymerase II transcription subunit 26a isoform X1 n=1 Tax=Brassica campestris TaxID=3711 RepID=UPI00142E581E|nr:probable mediator of RNA polymerase II transcription subunit 26a isoform X1 [Brassica rapa]